MMKLILQVALVVASTRAAADESPVFDLAGQFAGSYLCIGDASGGVRFDPSSKSWVAALFNAAPTKFVITVKPNELGEAYFSNQQPAMRYDVSLKNLGESEADTCRGLTDYTTKAERTIAVFREGTFQCTAMLAEYRFNLVAMRYMRAYRLGFIDGVDAQGNTPLVEIGRCSKID
jgi:hypothetical protein